MIVVDASVAVDMLLGAGSPAGNELATRFRTREPVCAPHLIDAEVAQVIRRFVLGGAVSRGAGASMIRDWVHLPVVRYPHPELLARAFDFLDNVTVYDGLYLALAEALACPLLTGDEALAQVPGWDAVVEVIATSPS